MAQFANPYINGGYPMNGYGTQGQYAAYQNAQAAHPVQPGSFISVRSAEEVYAWAIAPGNSITFYVETNPPMLATKTKGFSQLESPVIKWFDLTERQAQPEPEKPAEGVAYAAKAEVEALRNEVEQIKKLLAPKKEEVKDDE